MSAFHLLYAQLAGILYPKGLSPNFDVLHSTVIEELWDISDENGVPSYSLHQGVCQVSVRMIDILLTDMVRDNLASGAIGNLMDLVGDLVEPLYDQLTQDPGLVERARERRA